MPDTALKPDCGECPKHPIIEYKSNLAMGLLGANLFGVLVIAASVSYGVLMVIPDLKHEIVQEMSKVDKRASTMEYRLVALEDVAKQYLAQTRPIEVRK